MSNDLTKLIGGIIEMGVDTFTPDFTSRVALAPTSKSLTTGINQGTGPRYGISPIPGQSTADTTTAANSRGLRSAESSSGSALDLFINRRKFLGVLPVTMPSISSLTSALGDPLRLFFWLLSDWDGSQNTLTASPNTSYTDGGASKNSYLYKGDIGYGFYNPIWDQAANNAFNDLVANYNSPIIRRLGYANPTYPSAASTANFIKEVMKIPDSAYYCSSAVLTVPGSKWPQKWIAGRKITNGDATHTAIPNCVITFLDPTTGQTGGISPSWNMRDYKKSKRVLYFYNMYANQLAALYTYADYSVDDTTYVQLFNEDYTTAQVVLNTVATTRTLPASGAAYVAANVDRILINDEEMTCDSAYRLALVAAQGAFAYAVQDWQRDFSGRVGQLVSLTNRFHIPRTIASSGYTEYGYAQSSCFQNWPAFDGVTALPPSTTSVSVADPAYDVVCGPAGSGVLRASTNYEFTFSVFDKQFGIESNVGKPARFRTGTADFCSISLMRDQTTAGVYNQVATSQILTSSYFAKSDGTNFFYNALMNFIEIRFYYRPLGSFEWLPAYFIDYSKWCLWPNYKIHWACEGTIAALPGGQPGGFVDYSQLPQDTYDCVVNFKNRAFWLSNKNLNFSLQNNPFAYPLRNSAPAPTGGYKGAIIHTYRGQSDQDSRLVIFGQKETYIGRFTGIFQQMPVAVSPSVIASYDVDGSDFTIEPWTSITAFSYRSAVVADGILFWWGPQGVYRDDGVNVPTKVSKMVEPDIFSLYDESLTDEIHCIYDEKTKDIIWFYPPKDNNTKTYALTYDVEDEAFQFEQFDCKIDWATRINTNNPGVTQQTNGLRTIIGSRKDSSSVVQRGFFFDQNNRAGDMRPETELICKSVTSVSATVKTLGFDSGLDATNFATIAVGDFIAIQQFKKYTAQSTGDDIIAKVSAINTGLKTLTIVIPSDATLPAVSLTERFYFPIWHAANAGNNVISQGLNGIPWIWETKYWMPNGPNLMAQWQWLYLMFKYTAWKKVNPISFLLSYRTASGAPMITDTILFADNSDANFQLYHALRPGQLNNQGQAIKLKLSGTHIGEEWALQYLEAHVNEQDGNYLKQYQG